MVNELSDLKKLINDKVECSMEHNTLRSICWDITSRCNDHCKFCYRNTHSMDLSYEENQLILKKLIDFGVDKISFVGGEPLLYDRIFDLVEWGRLYCEGKTLFSITTNAILLTTIKNGKIVINEQQMYPIIDNFKWITFSLDAPNSRLQNKIGRNSLHFERIIALLSYAKQNNINRRIKINTVVCKDNMNKLRDIFNILKNYNVCRWKLFHFLPSRGNAAIYKDEYNISNEDFQKAVLELINLNVDKSIKISVNDYNNFDNSYVTITSEGKLNIYNGNDYVDKVDLKMEDINNILNHINLEKHKEKRSDFLDI